MQAKKKAWLVEGKKQSHDAQIQRTQQKNLSFIEPEFQKKIVKVCIWLIWFMIVQKM